MVTRRRPAIPIQSPGLDWARCSEPELLATRICDLDLRLEGSAVEPRYRELLWELQRRGLRFKPHSWLSSDWFSPDGCSGFAVPFYLAHPRLVWLERRQMLEVEGGSREQCLRLMRHEAAHAIDNAYRLRRKKIFRETFGRASAPYRSTYTPDPSSRDYVQNLSHWYGQSHPLEDFAETFAVWCRPRSVWRQRYAGWPALSKLEAVDQMMTSIATLKPVQLSRAREEPAHRLRMTLGEYYEAKRQVYSDEADPAFDGQLLRVFPPAEDKLDGRPRAARLLQRRRNALARRVAFASGQHRYLLDHVLGEMIARAKSRDLRYDSSEADALLDAGIVLTSLSRQFLYGAHPRYQR